MAKALSDASLTKESFGTLMKYISTKRFNVRNGTRMREIMDIVRETSSHIVNIEKYLASLLKMSLTDFQQHEPKVRLKHIIPSVYFDKTFETKLDRQQGILRFERNQSDFLPPIRLNSNQTYRQSRMVLLAGFVVDIVISALNLVGYPVSSLKKIKEAVLKVNRILHDSEMNAFEISRLKEGETDQETSAFTQVVHLLNELDKKGYIQEIVCDLTGAQSWFDGMKAIAKVTVIFATKFVYNDNIKRLLKVLALTNKISVLCELGEELKSRL